VKPLPKLDSTTRISDQKHQSKHRSHIAHLSLSFT
jgi:hypothetical protein